MQSQDADARISAPGFADIRGSPPFPRPKTILHGLSKRPANTALSRICGFIYPVGASIAQGFPRH
ncbi:MAG: hypothetical protein JJ992_19440, partial [Planctomycetes bacterium]|nr:hypothetical protein [Planctomycetota bacterium]